MEKIGEKSLTETPSYNALPLRLFLFIIISTCAAFVRPSHTLSTQKRGFVGSQYPRARHALIISGLLDKFEYRGRIESTISWLGGAEKVDLYVVSESPNGVPPNETDKWLLSLPSLVAREWLASMPRMVLSPELRAIVRGWPYGQAETPYLPLFPSLNALWKMYRGWQLMERTALSVGHTYLQVVRARTDMLVLAPTRLNLDEVQDPLHLVQFNYPSLYSVHSLERFQYESKDVACHLQPAPPALEPAIELTALPIFLPGFHNWAGFNDQFAFGPYESMRHYMKRLEEEERAVGECRFTLLTEALAKVTFLLHAAKNNHSVLVYYHPNISYCLDSPMLPCSDTPPYAAFDTPMNGFWY